MLNTELSVLRDRVVHWATEMRRWDLSWDTGIYPGEMAAFLGMADYARVTTIVESGRGEHAYSTHVLGEYAERTGTRVLSIDLELDPVKGQRCREQLARYARVSCFVGDAFDVLPRAMAQATGPIALLLDGPKETTANRFSLIATRVFPISVVAHHNCDPGLSWTNEFMRLFPGALHYESLGLDEVADWREFKQWEREAVKAYELAGCPGRSLSRSSLVMAAVPAAPRPILDVLALDGGITQGARNAAQAIRWSVRKAAYVRSPQP